MGPVGGENPVSPADFGKQPDELHLVAAAKVDEVGELPLLKQPADPQFEIN
jgi:hypothetical protein